jgi:CBS domain containing-hemolysin-like protein
LQIAAALAPVVKFLMAIFYVVARPIGLLLDAWLGTHDEHGKAPFNAKDLYTLLNLSRAGVVNTSHTHTEHNERLSRAPSILSGELSTPFLDDDAVLIAQGALISSKKTVRSIAKQSYQSVHGDDKITLEWLEDIGQTGFSRICVTQPTSATSAPATTGAFIGYFVVKEILCHLKRYLSSPCTVKDLPIYPIYYFKESDSVLVALNQFQHGHSRIAAVTRDGYPTSQILGYFSMEDVVEAIIQEEISDEKDSKQHSKALHHAARSPFHPPERAGAGAGQDADRSTLAGISLKEVSWVGAMASAQEPPI